MDMRTRRVTVEGLRGADGATLQVLTQDVIRLPLNQIDPVTLCDLFALSEVDSGMPADLSRDLSEFTAQRAREMQDLPDGNAVIGFAQELSALPGETIPSSLRVALGVLAENCKDEAALEVVQGLISSLEASSPEPVVVPEASAANPSAAAVAVKERTTAKKPPKKKKARAPTKDPARAEWIRGYVLERLSNYEGGLKESILVGGTRHKAPWDDLTDREVRSVLRELGRNGAVRTTVGRWLLSR